jgi:hypothetical protein
MQQTYHCDDKQHYDIFFPEDWFWLFDFGVLTPLSTIFQQYFNYIMATSFSGEGSRSTRGSSNSYKHITNTAWVRALLCILQKGCTRLAAASDTVYQLLAHGRWFSPGTPASLTTKTGRHDIVEILLKYCWKWLVICLYELLDPTT